MSSVRVQVLREPPRDRSIIKNLSGRIKISLVSLSYLHIGCGDKIFLETGETELGRFLRETRDVRKILNMIKFKEHALFSITRRGLTIPGSSIKGNVRARLELSFRNVDGKVRACFQRATTWRREPSTGEHGWRHYKIWGDVLKEDRGPACDYVSGKTVCLICDLFGTNGLRGIIEFSDLVQDKVSTETVRLPYGMELEVVKENSRFNGFIDFYNLRPEELGLIMIGMGLRDSRIGKPVLLGRLKYREEVDGKVFGKIRYEIDSIKLFRFSKPLKLHDIEIDPGREISDEKLNRVVKLLSEKALESYPGLNIVDEVKPLGKSK